MPRTDVARPPLPLAAAAWGTIGGRMIAMLLAIVTLYGVYSTPGLIGHWGGIDLAALAVLALWLGAAALAIPLFARRPDRRMWLALLAVTAALRIGIAIPCLDRIPGGDALFYPLLAYSLTAGHGLQVHEPFMAETVRALYPPLYPILLAAWNGAFGLATGALCALNLLIDGAAALLIARLGQRLGERGGGACGGVALSDLAERAAVVAGGAEGGADRAARPRADP